MIKSIGCNSNMYPKSFEQLVGALEALPGVGTKTAQRYAFTLLNKTEKAQELAEALAAIKNLRRCKKCGFLSENDLCEICNDSHRDISTIMVVASDQDLTAVERTGQYHGLYHVLNGTLSSTKGIYPEDLNLETLYERLDGIKEVIIAISPTIDGEMTALYLDKVLKKYPLKITRLAYGLPMGANLDYADDMTITKALIHRQKFEEQ